MFDNLDHRNTKREVKGHEHVGICFNRRKGSGGRLAEVGQNPLR